MAQLPVFLPFAKRSVVIEFKLLCLTDNILVSHGRTDWYLCSVLKVGFVDHVFTTLPFYALHKCLALACAAVATMAMIIDGVIIVTFMMMAMILFMLLLHRCSAFMRQRKFSFKYSD